MSYPRPPGLSVLTVVALVAVCGLACGPKVAPAVAYVPSYVYEPTSSTAGAGISLAIVRPTLSAAKRDQLTVEYVKSGQVPPSDLIAADQSLSEFSSAVSNGFTRYFTASGFTISGPFASVDEMTFPEKKQADLLLTVELDGGAKTPQIHLDPGLYWMSGPCTFSGNINLVMWEPLSMQRMWAKTIPFEPTSAECSINSRDPNQFNILLFNVTGKLYEAAFPSVMKSAERYFTPEEVALVKSQAQELRDRKVY